jgi:hypothetical protein
VATVTTGLVKGVSAGSPQITAFANGEPVQAGYICTGTQGCPLSNFQQSSGGGVTPTISGPNTLWWFNGLSLGVSGYSNQITLTASPTASSYQWSITAGSDKVQLGGSGQNQSVQVTSIGQSSASNDISITVTEGGVTSAPFKLTVKAPYQLGPDSSHPTPVYASDNNYVWNMSIYNTIEDNFGVTIPAPLDINESFGAVASDYSGNNWRQATPACASQVVTFKDFIGGESPSRIPTTPVFNPNFAGPKVQHWSQNLRAGTCTIGSGPRVQSDTIQKWTDHALHTGILSPNP